MKRIVLLVLLALSASACENTLAPEQCSHATLPMVPYHHAPPATITIETCTRLGGPGCLQPGVRACERE